MPSTLPSTTEGFYYAQESQIIGGVRMGVKEEKQLIIDDIAGRLKASKSTVLVDYRGLDVSQITDLRKNLREAGVDFKVYKNTLARRAIQAAELTELDEYLVGPTAIAFSAEDIIAPAKVLSAFAKANEDLEIKAGVIEGNLVSLDQIKEMASLPSREGLLSMLLSVLQAPARNFALVVKAVAEQKDEGTESAQESVEPEATEAEQATPEPEATQTEEATSEQEATPEATDEKKGSSEEKPE